jgi:tripartite-type tricarboxylate transporter receptor subunit TctC
VGTTAHIAVAYLESLTGAKFTTVPYRTSASQTTDLLGGHLDAGANLVPGFAELINAGKLTALAVTSDKRSVHLPKVPTVMELGYPGFDATAWYVLAAPAGTPSSIIAVVNKTVNDYLNSDTGAKQLSAFDIQVLGGTPENAKNFISAELKKWEPVVKGAGIRLQ